MNQTTMNSNNWNGALGYSFIHSFVNNPLPLPYESIPQLNHLRNFINNFTFEKDDFFNFSSFYPTTLIPVSFYLITTFILKYLFAGKPLNFKNNFLLYGFGFIHNVILSLGSLIMFSGMFYAFLLVVFNNYLNTFGNNGPDSFLVGICNSNGTYWNGGITSFWIWIFMISKWWEFIDTFLQCLKDKPLSFLHVYHHATVPLHMYLMLISKWDPAIFGFCFNAFVHIIMYYYYLQQFRGIHVIWKKLVTVIQIVQFVVCFAILGAALSSPHCEMETNSSKIALSSTFTLYLSYLILFIQFYMSTYKRGGHQGAKPKKD